MKSKPVISSAIGIALLSFSCNQEDGGGTNIQTQGARGIFDGDSTVVR